MCAVIARSAFCDEAISIVTAVKIRDCFFVARLSMNRNPEVGWIKRSGSTVANSVRRLLFVLWWIRFA